MVNFYDNYQQSKVMNYIPETAKGLLKAQKEQVGMDSEYYKLVNDMAERSNAQFVSVDDSKEYAERVGQYINTAKSLMADKSLDSDPVTKFRSIAKVHQDMMSDRRLQTLTESNKNMAKELDDVDPSLQAYVDRSVKPNLRTPDDGTVWNKNYAYRPDDDFKSIVQEFTSVVKPDILTDENGNQKKNPDGSYITEISDARINSWIDANAKTLMSTKPGAVYSVIDNIEKSLTAAGSDSDMKKINMDDAIHAHTVKEAFKIAIKGKLSEYANQKVSGGKKFSININNEAERPTDVVAPIDVLYKDLEYSGVISSVAAKMGVSPDGKTRTEYYDQLSKKIKETSDAGGVIVSKRSPVTSTMHSTYFWADGARASVIKKSDTKIKQIEVKGVGRSSNITAMMSNGVTIYPKIDQNTYLITSRGNDQVAGFNKNDTAGRLSRMADADLVSMSGSSDQAKGDYAILPNGEVGSITKIKIPVLGKGSINDPLSYLFGDDTSKKIKSGLTKNGSSAAIEIAGYGQLVFTRADLGIDKTPDGERGVYIEFEVARPIGGMTGPSLSSFGFNTEFGMPTKSTRLGASSNEFSFKNQ